ncbi:MAG TPA: beta-ketoacyl synthase N-terminal-like domain-containing protein, partial [Longimicrobiales bacterium]|nr:beta-ketoacyl synthase N-terminal-like domain-containing protein [Longimicrobiales bacterium]
MSAQRAASPAGMSLVKQALFEIRRLRAELDATRRQERDPIAIVGTGVRLPGGLNSREALWDALRSGVDAVGPMPRDRWDHDAIFRDRRGEPGTYYVDRGAFVDGVADFEPEFFGIAPLEALTMDPQQRILLETTWRALEDAGIPPASLRGTKTGVFVGIGNADYGRMVLAARERLDAYATSGTSFSVASGRIAYVLGLNGPAISVDTACSASLVATHLACQALHAGECDAALAAGVNVILAPEVTIDFCAAGMLSPDGKCRTFDAGADGYVRGEGCGVVVLKRLADAERDGDRILAVVRGTAINQDGRSSGLTAPSGPAQEAVIRAALARAGLEPADIGYVEAHGTGTSLGDPIEVEALGRVFGAGRREGRPLLIGSIKTNFGHLEAAAGIAGLIKAALVVHHGEVPPHLHFETPNPHIPWSELSLDVPTRLIPFPPGGERRRAGVSSFGFSGTNAHVIVESPPVRPESRRKAETDRAISRASLPSRPRPGGETADPTRLAASPTTRSRPSILAISARSKDALRAGAAKWEEHLRQTDDDFVNICFTAGAGRTHFRYRLAILAVDAQEAANRLAS